MTYCQDRSKLRHKIRMKNIHTSSMKRMPHHLSFPRWQIGDASLPPMPCHCATSSRHVISPRVLVTVYCRSLGKGDRLSRLPGFILGRRGLLLRSAEVCLPLNCLPRSRTFRNELLRDLKAVTMVTLLQYSTPCQVIVPGNLFAETPKTR